MTAVEWIGKNRNYYLPNGGQVFEYVINESFDVFVTRMSKLTEYGNHLTLVAICEKLGIVAHVLENGKVSTIRPISMDYAPEDSCQTFILLKYYPSYQHYDVILPIFWEDDSLNSTSDPLHPHCVNDEGILVYPGQPCHEPFLLTHFFMLTQMRMMT